MYEGNTGNWYAIAANTTYVGSVVDPLFGSPATTYYDSSTLPVAGSNPAGDYGYVVNSNPTGATDDTLSNFCMECHDLNGGPQSEMQGHPAHPIQATLSEDSAGDNTTYNENTGSGSTFYDNIVNGCTECHGSPMITGGGFQGGFTLTSPAANIGKTISLPSGGSMTYTSTDFNNDLATFDFPHTTPAPSYWSGDDILLKGNPDALCLSCHDSGGNSASTDWNSLP